MGGVTEAKVVASKIYSDMMMTSGVPNPNYLPHNLIRKIRITIERRFWFLMRLK